MTHFWSIAALIAVFLFALLVNSYVGISKILAPKAA
jgi:hypothetical protein